MSACSLDSDKGDDFEEIEIGHYTLDEATLSDFVYQEDSTIVFVDSTGKTLHLFLEKGPFVDLGSWQLIEWTFNNEKRYSFTNESQYWTLKNDSFFVKFEIEVTARPYAREPEAMYVADILNIYSNDDLGIRELAFYHEINQRTWPSSFINSAMPTFELIGRTFTNVYCCSLEDTNYTIYYTEELGIIGFEDFLGVMYRLRD